MSCIAGNQAEEKQHSNSVRLPRKIRREREEGAGRAQEVEVLRVRGPGIESSELKG